VASSPASREHTFVISQGSPLTRFRRALDSGSPTLALAAAHELPYIDLANALALVLVLRPDRLYPKAAARWHARLVADVPLTLAESQLVLAALAALPTESGPTAIATLERTFAAHKRNDLAEALLRWQ
jgi:hypothetical protein